jgi:mercuric ion transport protein
MKYKTMLRIGLAGTLVTAICCFTPALVVTLTALGLASAIAGVDAFLIPLLGLFTAFTFWAYTRRNDD